MNKEIVFPIEWEHWDDQGIAIVTFYNTTFLEDFGNFKKGEFYHAIDVDYNEGIMVFFTEEGDVEKSQNFICVPKTT